MWRIDALSAPPAPRSWWSPGLMGPQEGRLGRPVLWVFFGIMSSQGGT